MTQIVPITASCAPRHDGADMQHATAQSAQRPGPAPMLTPALQKQFCEVLSLHGNVRLACRALRVSPQTAYRARRASRDFAMCWDTALILARQRVEEVLAERAMEGVEEKVFYHGEEVATRIRYDSRLLLPHLARLDALAERVEKEEGLDEHEFEYGLDCLAAGLPVLASLNGIGDYAPMEEEEVLSPIEAALKWLQEHEQKAEGNFAYDPVPGVPG